MTYGLTSVSSLSLNILLLLILVEHKNNMCIWWPRVKLCCFSRPRESSLYLSLLLIDWLIWEKKHSFRDIISTVPRLIHLWFYSVLKQIYSNNCYQKHYYFNQKKHFLRNPIIVRKQWKVIMSTSRVSRKKYSKKYGETERLKLYKCNRDYSQ